MSIDKKPGNELKSEVGNVKGKKYIRYGIVLFIIVLVSLLLLKILHINIISGKITIEKVVIAGEIDAQGNPLAPSNQFNPNQPRIYCVVTVSAPKEINVGIRWYFEDKLIFEERAMVDRWRAFYIQPLPGKKFPEGNYRAEVYLIEDRVRTVYFTVGE
jgi:hypothetical protein